MLLYVVLGIVVIIGVIFGIAASRPAETRTARSIRIETAPERVWPHLASFRRWEAWSPWETLDPAMQRTFSGAEEGVGAVYAWKGNNKVGEGRMEILEAETPRRLLIRLDFIAPWSAKNRTEFTLVPSGSGTEVHWVMSGPAPMMIRVMGVFMDFEKMVGRDFEKGLTALKELSEA